MPWGWECRARLVKQVQLKPTQRRGKDKSKSPGPQQYEPPELFCGDGYSHIRRAPAYTFGHLTPVDFGKSATANAKMLNTRYITHKGPEKLTHGVVTPRIEPPGDKTKVPGPGQYAPRDEVRTRRPPAYSVRPPAPPPYVPEDMWTPSPNMYCPALPGKNLIFLNPGRRQTTQLVQQQIPGPGEHEPNFHYIWKNPPQFSFAATYRNLKPPPTPAPNEYCHKKFHMSKPNIRASTFGIRHTPYLGQQETYLKPSKLDVSLKTA